jgi:hypothetical protein
VKVLNVEKLIVSQSQKHKERLLSQFSRLTDSTPSFPLYYSIDGINSSAEIGTRQIMQYVGPDSPVKFKRIDGMPLYAIDVVDINVTYDETLGTYTDFSGQALALNSIIKPLPGDHFIIKEFNPEVIFCVTDVLIRAIRGEDHCVLQFSVVPTSRILNIERQVSEIYKTIFRNIGTEDKVLILSDEYDALQELMESYRNIHDRYVDEFYDKALSYLKTPESLEGLTSYGTCKYLINFLMKNRTIYFDEILESIFLFEIVLPFEARHNKLYTQTFPLLNFVKQKLIQGSVYIVYRSLPISLFNEISKDTIEQSIEFKFIPAGQIYSAGYQEFLLYDETFTAMIQSKNYTVEGSTPIKVIIAKFMNNEDILLTDYNDVIDDYGASDLFRMYFMPLILIILKVKIKSLQTTLNN